MNKELSNMVFDECLTEKGLAELRTRFPSDVVTDMSVDAVFKAARKSRTERNKLVESINRRRIDVSTEVKGAGDLLIDEITEIFDAVVVPFEVENKRRQDVEVEKKLKHEKMLNDERANIAGFSDFIKSCEDSKSISSAIDGITNIDCSVFHKDVIHEAFAKKEEVLSQLSEMLTNRIALEAAEIERKKAEDLQKESERKRLIENKLNDLKMIPVNFMGKSSEEISDQLDALKEWEPSPEMFDHLHAEAVEALSTVIQQLEQAKTGAEVIEKAIEDEKQVEADRLQKIEDDRRDAEPAAELHVIGDSSTEYEGPEGGPLDPANRKPSEAEIITRFFAGFAEFNPEQAEAITEVIMSDGVPGVTIEVTKEK